jgi:ATP-dependent Clp protease ATP-binding subunit ClpA
MIGSPPGYVGHEEGGQLSEKVRRNPYAVILFDEIEKAHPDVFNILLQVLDDGHITDSQGRKVDFRNTVIIMTSNAGSQKAETSLGFGKSAKEISKEKVLKALNEFLRPEFIGRVDEIVVFNPLSDEDYKKIAILMMDEMKTVLKDKGIEFVYDENTPSAIVSKMALRSALSPQSEFISFSRCSISESTLSVASSVCIMKILLWFVFV